MQGNRPAPRPPVSKPSPPPTVITKNDLTWGERASEYMTNEGPKIVFIILWVLSTVAIFGWKWWGKMFPNKGS